MAEYGLLPEGFLSPSLDELRTGMEDDARGRFGRSLPLGDDTVLGFLIGIVAERIRLLWEVSEAGYSSQDPDKAVDAALDALCLLTATFRVPAVPSAVVLTLCGELDTPVGAGFTVSTVSTGRSFATLVSVGLSAVDAWAPSTDYVVGDRVSNGGEVYQCTTGGTSDVAGGPTGADFNADVVDGGVHWKWIGTGAAAGDVLAACSVNGPIVAVAGDLTDIQTPTGGVNTCINLLDAELGANLQTNQDLRLLREEELSKPGTGTPDAIRAAVLDLDGVTSCTVFFNNTDQTDADGILPHSCEVLVRGGDDQDIVDCLWANVDIGIRTVGTSSGFATDAEGEQQLVNFSRPEEIQVWVDVTLKKVAKTYAGDDAVKAAISTQGATREIGDDAVASMISSWVFTATGVKDVTQVLIGTAPAPVSSATIPLTTRQIALYDTTRVTVHSSDDSP